MKNSDIERAKDALAGFTLVELLTVMAIICILLGTLAGATTRARRLAKVAKAESELRELVNACQQFRLFSSKSRNADTDKAKGDTMPFNGKEVEVSRSTIAKLIDASKNSQGIIYYNANFSGEKYLDPWGTPYKLRVNDGNEKAEVMTKLKTSVSFPNRGRR